MLDEQCFETLIHLIDNNFHSLVFRSIEVRPKPFDAIKIRMNKEKYAKCDEFNDFEAFERFQFTCVHNTFCRTIATRCENAMK